jgi:hypothetical protein
MKVSNILKMLYCRSEKSLDELKGYSTLKTSYSTLKNMKEWLEKVMNFITMFVHHFF